MNLADVTNQTIFQQSPISTQIFSPSGESLMANEAWEKLWGVKHSQIGKYNILKDAQLVKKGVMPYIKRGFKGEIVQIPAIKYEPGKTVNVEGVVPYRWVSALIYPVRDSSKKIVQIVLQHQDITRQSDTEEMLRQSEERLRLALAAGKIGVWDWDIRANTVIWSERVYEIHGLKKHEFEGTVEAFTSLIHPDDAKRVGAVMKRALANKTPYQLEFRVKGPHGKTIWIYTSARVIFDGSNPIRMLGAAIDVTHQKELEKQKDETLSFLELVLRSAPVGIFRTDRDGNCVYVNKKWCTFAGMTPEQAKGRGWIKALHTEDRKRVFEEWYEATKKNKEFTSEYRFQTSSGKVTWLHGNATSIKDANNTTIGYLGIIVDITERKKLEHQKDDFLGIASHELKTPVTSLKAFTQALQRKFVKGHDEQSALLLSKMDAQINKLTSLINDLLDVTKVEAGRLKLQKERFSFDELVDEIVEQVQRTTQLHKIIIKGGTRKMIHADRERIGQVITNFLTNAIKYSPESQKIIVTKASDDKYVRLSVQDFGVGIPTNKLPRIFERFYRVDEKTHNTVPGMGLGLYISKEIITRQRGKVWVESTRGKGSTFYFTVPVR